jgi:hypothetical protein
MIITKPECYLDPEFLDKLWCKYVDDRFEGQRRNYYHPRDYANVSRRGHLSQQFEQWLWEEGAVVRQINGKRYLEFSNSKNATMFALRWT